MAKKTDDLKITDEQLQNLQGKIKIIQNIQTEVGMLEARKFNMLNQQAMQQVELGKLQKELEEEYGKVNINVTDGTITEVKEDEADKKD
jgi:TolA-binding protein|tara:strand:+ start:219 stop:485 length:267 start_codon:yes stop_codon:yes gene_type:complete